MSKSDERRMAALVRKTAEKVAKAKPKTRRQYDDTLPSDRDATQADADGLFKEMKKREF